MSTKIALTFQDKQTVSGHAGHCNYFLIYDIDDNGTYQSQELVLSDEQTLHNVLHDSAQPHSPLFDVDMLLVESIGMGAIQKLAQHHVAAHIIREKDPETAIQKLVQGTLEAYAPEGAHHHGHGGCGCGNGHHHEHEHEHEHAHSHEGCGCSSEGDAHEHGHGGCGCSH